MQHRYSLPSHVQAKLVDALAQAQAALPREGIPKRLVDQALALDERHQQEQRDLYAERQSAQGELNSNHVLVDDDATIKPSEQAGCVWVQAWIQFPAYAD